MKILDESLTTRMSQATCQRLRRKVLRGLSAEEARVSRCGSPVFAGSGDLCLTCRAGWAYPTDYPVCSFCGKRLPSEAAHDEMLAFCGDGCGHLYWGLRAFLGEARQGLVAGMLMQIRCLGPGDEPEDGEYEGGYLALEPGLKEKVCDAG